MPTSRRMSKLIVVYLYNRTLKISEIRNTRVTNINMENLTNLLIEKKKWQKYAVINHLGNMQNKTYNL